MRSCWRISSSTSSDRSRFLRAELEGLATSAFHTDFLLHLLEGLHDGLRKGDGVDVVVRILFEKQPELLPRSVLLSEEEVGCAQVFAGFQANDRVRRAGDDPADERLEPPGRLCVALLVVAATGGLEVRKLVGRDGQRVRCHQQENQT